MQICVRVSKRHLNFDWRASEILVDVTELWSVAKVNLAGILGRRCRFGRLDGARDKVWGGGT